MRRRDTLIAASAFAAGACVTTRSGAPSGIEEAFLYAFPLYEFTRTQQARAGWAPGTPALRANQAQTRAALLDHTARQITSPNNDTLYTSAALDLSGGPVIVAAPPSRTRYMSIAFMDAFTDNFAYIGTRGTKGAGGEFAICGPSHAGPSPDGLPMFRSDTNDVWMLGRTLVDGPDDLAAAAAVARAISVRAPRHQPRPYRTQATSATDAANFVAVVNETLERCPVIRGHSLRAARFKAFGIGPGVMPSTAQIRQWSAFLPDGLAELRHRNEAVSGAIGGWLMQEKGVGRFGRNDRLRARTALGGLAALEEAEAMYFQGVSDEQGAALTGSASYRWRVPKGGVPVDGFWSLTLYQVEADGRYFFADNPIRRYALGNRTPDLFVNADGSCDIIISHREPGEPLRRNWLPAPDGPIRLSLRAYLPAPPLRERRWPVPPIQRIG
jgi:hypothetical protein